DALTGGLHRHCGAPAHRHAPWSRPDIGYAPDGRRAAGAQPLHGRAVVAPADPATRRPGSTQEYRLTFDSLGLSADLLKTVSEEGYTEPTPVQAAAIPLVLAGRDVLAAA